VGAGGAEGVDLAVAFDEDDGGIADFDTARGVLRQLVLGDGGVEVFGLAGVWRGGVIDAELFAETRWPPR